jgi:phosphoglycerate dehydrogenase-like enzyme
MYPGLDGLVFEPATLDRLTAATRLVSPTPSAAVADDWRDVEILVTGWGCPALDAAALDRLPDLRLVAHAAGTVRGLVTDALWDRGVTVTSAAAANAVPVAEFTFAAVVMAAKDLFGVRDRHRRVRGASGVVDQGRMGTRGRRIGLIGASTIGRLVIERLRTLDVELAVTDPYLDADDAQALGVTRMDLDDLLGWADIVSVHAPALPSTRHLLDAAALARMPDGAWLINTARGSLVDTDALTAELVSGRLHAFIDTPDPEPLPADSPLYGLDNAVLTPHIAGSMGSEVARMGDLAVTEVERFVAGQPLLHPVTRADLDRIA